MGLPERPDEKIEYRAGTFILASGHIWSTHLLLLSACSRFPNGLANSTDQVGRYMNGHAIYAAMVELESDEAFPGMNNGYSLISRRFMRSPVDKTYMRHDLRIFPGGVGLPRDRRICGTHSARRRRGRTRYPQEARVSRVQLDQGRSSVDDFMPVLRSRQA